MKFLSYKQLECVLLENDGISVRYLFFGSHLNMKFCGFTVTFMQKIAKCYGNEYVLTIKEKKYRDNNVLLIRSTDERASCLSRSSTFQKNN